MTFLNKVAGCKNSQNSQEITCGQVKVFARLQVEKLLKIHKYTHGPES